MKVEGSSRGPRPHLSWWFWIGCSILLLLLLIFQAYPVVWAGAAINGKVVDKATGKPIAGAVVAASWMVTSWESYPVKLLAFSEVVTDEAGEFHVPGFPPRFYFSPGRVINNQPTVYVIADGWHPHVMHNSGNGATAPPLIRFTSTNLIVLDRVNESDRHYEESLGFFEMEARRLLMPARCRPEGLVKMVVEFDKARARLGGLEPDPYRPGSLLHGEASCRD